MERKTDDFLSLLDEKMRLFNEYHKELEQRARIEQGKQQTMLNAIINISKNMNISYKQTMDALNLSQDEQEKYLSLLNA